MIGKNRVRICILGTMLEELKKFRTKNHSPSAEIFPFGVVLAIILIVVFVFADK